jgi:hypothetical protein
MVPVWGPSVFRRNLLRETVTCSEHPFLSSPSRLWQPSFRVSPFPIKCLTRSKRIIMYEGTHFCGPFGIKGLVGLLAFRPNNSGLLGGSVS